MNGWKFINLTDVLLFFFPCAGEANAVLAKAEAKAKAIRLLSEALTLQVHLILFWRIDHTYKHDTVSQ